MDLVWASYDADFGNDVQAGDAIGVYWFDDFEGNTSPLEGDVQDLT